MKCQPYIWTSSQCCFLSGLDCEFRLIGWAMTEGTYNADRFYEAFLNAILPHMNPFPGPRSAFVCDGTSIHKDHRVHDAIASIGGVSVVLQSYSPEYNPIEKVFGVVKRYA